MRLLLDTHALIWFLNGSELLPQSLRQMIVSTQNDVFVSAASALELAEKLANGRWPTVGPLVDDFPNLFAASGFRQLPVTADHALAAAKLAPSTGDLVDRLLAAQALTEAMLLVSVDIRFDRFGIRRVWS